MAHEISRLLFLSRKRREAGGWEGELRGDYCAGPVKSKYGIKMYSVPRNGHHGEEPGASSLMFARSGVRQPGPWLGGSTQPPPAVTLLFYTRWKYGPGFVVSLFLSSTS